MKRVKELLIDMNNVPVCSLPDHSVLIADLELSDFFHVKQMAKENDVISPFIFGKKYNVSKIPTSFMDDDEANSETADFLDYVQSLTHSKETANVMYEQFINVLNIEMQRKLPRIKKPSGGPRKRSCQFWDKELEGLFKAASAAEKSFCKFTGPANIRKDLHKTFQNKQKEFDIAFRRFKG